MFGFMKSTRSIAVVMILLLLYVVVIGTLMGGQIPDSVLAIVSTSVGAIVTAYFGKRDTPEDQGK